MGNSSDMKFGKHLNKYGCYENQEFLALSLNILFEVEILLNYPKRLTNYENKMKKVAEKYQIKFKKLIQKYSKEPIWGFKDASSIYYLPYFLNETTNPKYIHLIRNYESTANSLCDTFSSKNWKHEIREKIPLFTPKNRIKLFLRLIKLYFTERKNQNPEFFMKIVAEAHN